MQTICIGVEKIIGQVQAIDRMVDEDVPCEDILSQINAAKSALNGCGKVVLEGHIQHCVRDGIQHGDADKPSKASPRPWSALRICSNHYTLPKSQPYGLTFSLYNQRPGCF